MRLLPRACDAVFVVSPVAVVLIGPESGVLATINRMDPIHVAFSIAET